MSKQSKQYESMRQTQANTFSDGLNMDLHPLTTPNTILTDCVNGTMITYNDNEFVLQNERGNSKIDGAHLSDGFIPVAMKEYNGILYIVSHNPQTKHTEIGTFPSPKKSTNSNLNEFNKNVNVDSISYYTEYEKNVIWYDYNLSVSNYDKYKLSVNNVHPLIVLEHFVLDKQGNITKITLNENNTEHRFTHVGEGVLGYKYRPYFISSVISSIIPSKGAKWAQLNITTTSDDEELWKNIDNLEVSHEVTITLISDNENQMQVSIEDISDNGIKSLSTIANNWDYTHDFSSTDTINLQFKQEFVIDGKTYKYDFRKGVIVSMENDSPTNIEYNKIKFNITSKISKGDWVVYMDHLNSEITSDLQSIFTQESWFSKFQYYLSEDQSGTNADEIFIDFDIELDLEAYDVNYGSYTESNKGEATYKLHEINDNGDLKGIQVTNANVFTSSKIWDVVSDENLFNGKHDLLIDENKGLHYLKSDVISPVQKSTLIAQCAQLTSDNNPKYVRYVKENDETYNIVLYDKDFKVVSKDNIFSTLNGSQCGNDMDEYFEPGFLNYSAKGVKVKWNKIYLFELMFNVLNISENKWKKEYVSFIVVTSNKMLDPEFGLKYDRMDEILLKDWFGGQYDINRIINSTPYYRTDNFPNKYKNNKIDLNILNSKTIEEVPFYAKKFFLKYNSLFPSEDKEWIPSISQRINSKFSFNNKSEFNCKVKLEGFNDIDINKNGSIDYDYEFDKKISLSGNATEYNQKVERKYLWDLFKETDLIRNVNCGDAYNIGGQVSWGSGDSLIETDWGTYGSFIYLNKNYYLTAEGDPWDEKKHFNYLLSTKELKPATSSNCKKRKGRCNDTSGGDVITGNQPTGSDTIFGASTHILNINNGFNFGSIKNGDYVKYTGNLEKIWTFYKNNSCFYLVGIDVINNLLDSQLAYDTILKHAYYLNDVNKTVYQYAYDKEDIKNDAGEITGSQIKIIEQNPTLSNITGRLFPSQCIFINKDYSSYNIQSYNNLNYNNLQNVNSSIYTGQNSIVFEEFDKKYIIFLRELGDCLNRFYITNDVLQQYNNSSLYFDYDSELFDNDSMSYILFYNEVEDEKKDDGFFMPLENINNPYLKYDKENNILYTDKIEEDQIDQFEYTGGDCVAPLKWNYSLTFDEFWNGISVDSIDKLNKYHSLLFYRYSSYADE